MKQELWLIWKNPSDRRRHLIGILNKYADEYIFKYNIETIEEIKENGFDYFPGFENINKRYSSKELFTNIKSRLPNPTRPDYLEILEMYNLNVKCTDMEILEKTKGRLLTDDFEFVPYFNKEKIEFDIAGTRYCDDLKKCKEKLKIGDKLTFKLEENNKYDKNAIQVIYGEKGKFKIGYVPRFYSEQIAILLKSHNKYIAKINALNVNSKFQDETISVKLKFIF